MRRRFNLLDRLFDIFKELIIHTAGDFDEAISWLREIDVEYKLTDKDYTIDDFIEDLKKKGYIRDEINEDGTGGIGITAKTERAIRQQALDQIFGNLKKQAMEIIKQNMLEVVMNKQASFGIIISAMD